MVSRKEIKAFYDSRKAGERGIYVSTYDQEGRLFAILSLIDLEKARTVLDVGCGVGWLTRQYAKLTQGQVIGINFSKESISEARDKAAKEGLSNLKFKKMDAEDLQFENDTFDCIICSEVLEHLLDPQKALNEMRRVVKPSGRIAITTPNPWNWNAVFRKLTGKVKEQPYEQLISPSKLNKMIENAGMRIIKRKWTYYLPPVSPQRKPPDILVRLSKFIERKNLLPYMGLYQVCLLRPATGVRGKS